MLKTSDIGIESSAARERLFEHYRVSAMKLVHGRSACSKTPPPDSADPDPSSDKSPNFHDLLYESSLKVRFCKYAVHEESFVIVMRSTALSKRVNHDHRNGSQAHPLTRAASLLHSRVNETYPLMF